MTGRSLSCVSSSGDAAGNVLSSVSGVRAAFPPFPLSPGRRPFGGSMDLVVFIIASLLLATSLADREENLVTNARIALIGGLGILAMTILSVTSLYIWGSQDVQGMLSEALLAIGGTVGSGLLMWLSASIQVDADRDGVPDLFDREIADKTQSSDNEMKREL